MRATGTGLTDGVGHPGAIFGPPVAGVLLSGTATAGHYGWFLYVTVPGSSRPTAE